MNRIKLHVRKGDQVEVIAGNFKGSSGKVLERAEKNGKKDSKGKAAKSADKPKAAKKTSAKKKASAEKEA